MKDEFMNELMKDIEKTGVYLYHNKGNSLVNMLNLIKITDTFVKFKNRDGYTVCVPKERIDRYEID